MKEVIVRRRTCRLCEGASHALILSLAPSPIADAYVPAGSPGRAQASYPLDLFLCTTCGHAQLLDVIDADVLYRDYIYVTTSSLGLGDHFEEYAASVARKLEPDPGALVIDIGSNDGTLLGHFRRRGLRVLGVEPAREIARRATEEGVETLPEFFDLALALQIRAKHGAARLVTMNNLFANIDDLGSTAEGIRALLAPDGVFVFETFYFVDYIENLVFDFMYHEHLSYNTVKPLRRYFAAHGMELFDVERVPTKGGSIRCSVQISGGPRKVASAVAAHVWHEDEIGIHEAGALFEGYRRRIDAQKVKLNAELARLRGHGKSIAGYGASATSTTLIYHFGLEDQLAFLIDDNPAKQDTVSPGCRLPVYSSSSIAEREPGVIVILAWRYVEPIVRKNADYLRRGGTFIVPLPEVQVL